MPFQPGNTHSANRRGKSKKTKSLSEVIRSGIGAPAIMRALKAKLESGDMQAISLACAYGWAKPVADIDDRLKAIEDRLDEAEQEASV